jgi:CHASE2 domain-containing sensor protein
MEMKEKGNLKIKSITFTSANGYLLLLLFLVLSCSKSHQVSPGLDDNNVKDLGIDDTISLDADDIPIVLFNMADLGRGEISQMIQAINKCEPKVIGLKTIFQGVKLPKDDSLLVAIIRESNKIVLFTEVTEDDEFVSSDEKFSDYALGNGTLTLGTVDDVTITSYVPVFEGKHGQSFAFPLMLARIYANEETRMFFKSIVINRHYEIDFTRHQDQFIQFEYKDLKSLPCDAIRGKIALIGYLGPEDISNYYTPLDKNGNKTYTTVIIANIVLTILDKANKKNK